MGSKKYCPCEAGSNVTSIANVTKDVSDISCVEKCNMYHPQNLNDTASKYKYCQYKDGGQCAVAQYDNNTKLWQCQPDCSKNTSEMIYADNMTCNETEKCTHFSTLYPDITGKVCCIPNGTADCCPYAVKNETATNLSKSGVNIYDCIERCQLF